MKSNILIPITLLLFCSCCKDEQENLRPDAPDIQVINRSNDTILVFASQREYLLDVNASISTLAPIKLSPDGIDSSTCFHYKRSSTPWQLLIIRKTSLSSKKIEDMVKYNLHDGYMALSLADLSNRDFQITYTENYELE